ncbi:hypothetical protein TanjilG_01374 [Lupinus angustifolius]|nr:hypothetical protein TanjilG_01374 [Lupinus angustifolius]
MPKEQPTRTQCKDAVPCRKACVALVPGYIALIRNIYKLVAISVSDKYHITYFDNLKNTSSLCFLGA